MLRFARTEHELLVHLVEEGLQRVDRRRDLIALDAGDRRLRRAGADGELLLGQPVAEACPAQELTGRRNVLRLHALSIADPL
jgi:hypothetical protein